MKSVTVQNRWFDLDGTKNGMLHHTMLHHTMLHHTNSV